jgi:hypothetical protein
MSGVEPEVQDFLKKVLRSVFFGLFWLIINMTLGIYFEFLFFEGRPSPGNILYYLFLLGSLFALVRFYYITWNRKFPHG